MVLLEIFNNNETINNIENFIYKVIYEDDIRFTKRIDKIENYLNNFNLKVVGIGTNRFVVSHDSLDCVIKIPYHKGGVYDNDSEYSLSKTKDIEDIVAKSYDISNKSYMLLAEKLEVVKKEDWSTVRSILTSSILPSIENNYVYGDMLTDVARTNIGIDKYNEIKILDYAYFINKNNKHLVCEKCNTRLNTIRGSEVLVCPSCDFRTRVNRIVDIIRQNINKKSISEIHGYSNDSLISGLLNI